MSDSTKLPVLPLRDTVFFPGITAPIGVGRPGTLAALQAAVANEDGLVFAICQRKNVADVEVGNLYTVGTVARISQLQRMAGSAQLLLEGQYRAVAVRFDQVDGYLEATVREAETRPPAEASDPAFLALVRELRERASELGEKAGFPAQVVSNLLDSVDEPGRLADLVAGYIDLPSSEKQALLEELDTESRIRKVLVSVQRQIDTLDAQKEVKERVQQELGDRQREMVLREQMKAIQDELGEDGAEELDDLEEALVELELPPAARKEIDRELKRLRRMSRDSMEYQMLRTYLETVVELPWDERSEDHLDLGRAEEILEEDHYGLEKVKDRVLEYLAVRKLHHRRLEAADDQSVPEGARGGDDDDGDAGDGAGRAARPSSDSAPILLFVGPPGVGKTSIAKSIARAIGREYVRISLGGARDEADIRGHRRTYVGAMPGRIIRGMRQAGTRNPVFLLDEVDKLGVSYQGDPASALLEVLDPAQNDSFVDHYLGVPFDLSEVLFIATANLLQQIPGPLIDRMEIVEFSGYTEQEKLEIARRYLVPRQLDEHAMSADELRFDDEALSAIIARYTREAGVRQLERQIGKVTRKVARRIAAGEIPATRLDGEAVRDVLGRPEIHPEKALAEDQVGIATGMYYTPAGGDIMFVEASTMPGKGELVLTGQLGDVMKESARAAWSYARAHADELGIDAESFERDLHIHVPAGAIPKDGPSAGITMATAVVSCLSGRSIRHDIAMTGEVTLSGRVLPIGGVKEKVLGAIRAGVRRVVLPQENVDEFDELPDEIREQIEVTAVETLGDVLAAGLAEATFDGRRALGPAGDRGGRPTAEGLAH